ncbi:hypothetical protein [Microvirga calopogonii]|uniref:hypothetical protein n=1 Tax=Microvirga calopogonii TaxID=2078013 RepID=UPI001FE16F0B|nr:hypothetical protein [Microvirga calopogonii]
MKHEQAHPPGRVNGVLMWVVARLGDAVGNVVNGDDAVEQRDRHEEEDAQRQIVQEGIAHGLLPPATGLRPNAPLAASYRPGAR